MPEQRDWSKGGRHSKLTPEVQEKIISAIRAGNYAQVAAKYAGIAETTYYVWLQRGKEESSGMYKEFREAVKKAESEAEVRAVAMMQKHMTDNWQAAMTYLERKFPDRWGRTNRLKIDIGSRQVLKDTLALSEAELNEMLHSVEGP
jgi:transposase